MAEVYAGFVSYTDHEIGRLVDYLEESGQLDNTIVVVVSDNGASGEGGPNGSLNENKFFNNVADDIEENLRRIDEIGTERSYNHYCNGWAWAFDTPFPYWKRFAGYEGGTADMCIVSWPAGIEAHGAVRHQYVHAVDVVPTLYELLGIRPPDVIKGYTQSPIEGESFVAALTDDGAPGRETQFFSMLGQRAIYDDGWLANTMHPPISGWGNFEADRWELYHLAEDRTQLHDLAARGARAPRAAQGPAGSTGPAASTGSRSTTAPPASSSTRSARSRARRATATSTTPTPPRSPSRSRSTSGAARSPSPRRSTSSEDAEGVLFVAGRRGRRARPVRPGRTAALRLQLARRQAAGGQRADAAHRPAGTS